MPSDGSDKPDNLMTNHRAFLWGPVALGLGIAIYFHLAVEPSLLLSTALLLVSLGLYWRLAGRGQVWRLALIGLCFVALGFAVAKVRTELVDAPILEKRIGPVTVTGAVQSVDPLAKGVRVIIENPRISRLQAYETPRAVRLKLQGPHPDIQPGDWIRLRAILTPPPPPAEPGAFDFQRYAFFQGLGGVGFSLSEAEIIKPASDADALGLMSSIGQLRQTIGERVRASLNGETGAVSAALMTGEKRAIGEPTLNAMRDAGLAHLLAISGLHVGLVAGVVFIAFRGLLALSPGLAQRYPIKKWAAAASLGTAIFYCLMAGATVPTVRAAFMAGLVLLAVMLDLRAITLRLVALAALVILVFQPEVLLSASFQMSFAAVTALVAVYETIRDAKHEEQQRRWYAWYQRPFVYFCGVALTTLVASAATGVFAAYHFNRIADYSLLANLIAVPITALWVMPWAVVSYIAMAVGLEAVPLHLMGIGVSLVLDSAAWVAGLPGAVQRIPAFPAISLPLLVIGGLVLCLWRGRWRLSGLAVIALGIALIPSADPPDILIGGRGDLAAVRGDHGQLVFANPKGRRFVKEVWLRRAGQADVHTVTPLKRKQLEAAAWRGQGNTGQAEQSVAVSLQCDHRSCLYRSRGRAVALAKVPGALLEDCWQADLVISAEPVRGACDGAIPVVDRFDLWKDGAHAIWITGDGTIIIRTVNGVRGKRPWVPNPAAIGP